jgi:hypothetical protein
MEPATLHQTLNQRWFQSHHLLNKVLGWSLFVVNIGFVSLSVVGQSVGRAS